MNTLRFLLLLFIISSTSETTINDKNKCTNCSQIQSQDDCKMLSNCSWVIETTTNLSTCQQIQTPTVYFEFCQNIDNPSQNCATTIGCSFIENVCTHFTGCSAFVKTITEECQAISNLCISDGTQCINAKSCSDYIKEPDCQLPSLSGTGICVWENGICRDQQCSEANQSLNSNEACNQWLNGCITNGIGCTTQPLSDCNAFSGTEEYCSSLSAVNNTKCELLSGATNCSTKICSNADKTISTNEQCAQYQTGCITTGKGCTDILGKCSNYNGDVTSCVGYIGTDGICEGDAGGIQCRGRICENFNGKSKNECNNYKIGCVTNSYQCVTTLNNCEYYQGTSIICSQIIGANGNCKGTSTTISEYCIAKDCVQDSTISNTSDQSCQLIQSNCVTNGRGCVKKGQLGQCATFTGTSSECQSYIGIDGKCKSSQNNNNTAACVKRECEDVSYSQNNLCSEYQVGCISNGVTCITPSSCSNTILQLNCSNTSGCSWNQSCMENTCQSYKNQSICLLNKEKGIYPCKWIGNQCMIKQCSDLTDQVYQTDQQCNSIIPGCVSNGKLCIDVSGSPQNYCSQFQGDQTLCESFTAKCSQDSNITDQTINCRARTCADNKDLSDDTECDNYLQNCLTKLNGCISNTEPCQNYTGTQSQCDKFKGYDSSSSQRIRCWSIDSLNSVNCIPKICSHADNVIGQSFLKDKDCDDFLEGCIWDGKTSCISSSSSCSSFFGTQQSCYNLLGNNKTQKCYGSKNNSINDHCHDITCEDKGSPPNGTTFTDSDCSSFFESCVSKYNSCVPKTTTCDDITDLSKNQCEEFNKINTKCVYTVIDVQVQCLSKTCEDTQAINLNCQGYLSTCRKNLTGDGCISSQSECSQYSLGNNIIDQTTYCNSLSIDDGTTYCAYDKTTTENCVDRYCELFPSNLSPSECENYTGYYECIFSQISQLCYTIQEDCRYYEFPDNFTDDQKKQFCNGLTDINSNPCSAGNDTCLSFTCEDIDVNSNNISSSDQCNAYAKLTNCLFNGQQCVTIADACYRYTVTSDNAQTICPLLVQIFYDKVTSCVANGSQCSRIQCENIQSPYSQADCDYIGSNCIYFDYKCWTKQSNCSDYQTSQSNNPKFCINMIGQVNGKSCGLDTSNSGNCQNAIECSSLSASSYTDCLYEPGPNQLGCIHDGASNCMDPSGPALCELQISNPINQDSCDQSIKGCHFYQVTDQGSTPLCNTDFMESCNQYAAMEPQYHTKLQYCQNLKQSLTQKFCTWDSASNTCVDASSNCSDYNTSDKTYCQNKINAQGQRCSFTTGESACRNFGCLDALNPKSQADCNLISSGCVYNYDKKICVDLCSNIFANGNNQQEKQTYCKTLSQTLNGVKTICGYLTGNYCDIIKNCESYSSLGVNCTSFISSNNKYCINPISDDFCVTVSSCDQINILNPTKQEDCDKYYTDCLYFNNTCVNQGDCNTYNQQNISTVNLITCSSLIDKNTNKCTFQQGENTCKARTCLDNQATFTTHAECNNYLKSCTTDGTRCISFKACNTQQGTPNQCLNFYDLDTINKCTTNVAVQTSSCQIDNQCNNAAGNFCISKVASCSSYKGTQSECSNFYGNNGTIKCWGSSTTQQAACFDKIKECTDNVTSTTDIECDNFIKRQDGAKFPVCVTNGKGCVNYGQTCNSVTKGNETICSYITASDGPCKSVLQGQQTSSCTQRVCVEAPNTYKTDAECQNYHPSCYTTGQGCNTLDNLSCLNFSSNTLCSNSQKGCQWNNNCLQTPLTCDSMTTQSICVNTLLQDGKTKCAWSGTKCRNYTCVDQPSTNITHAQCYALSTISELCTTTGNGCITYSTCTSYKTSSICSKAQTTENSQWCTWDNQQQSCRQRQCIDNKSAKTDTECNTYLNGCVTNGNGCIGPDFDCSSFTTQQFCQKNSKGVPCLLIEERCIEYVGCTSISFSSHEQCQQISTKCTTDGNSCIPISACNQMSSQISCIIGTDGICGWLPTLACQKFNSCNEVNGTTFETCQNYSLTCISDGNTCVDYSNCSSYQSEQACQNNKGGTDGPCNWNNNICSQRVCNDKLGTTDSDCQQFVINQGNCTTDGTKCISRSDCKSYLSEIGCVIGTDGPCIWSYPYGYSSGEKSCRIKTCSDIQGGITNEICKADIRLLCVSNGLNCINKSSCSNYLSNISCKAGGIDGICAFNPVPTLLDANAGICKLFTQCQDANNDQSTCTNSSISPYCQWVSTVSNNITITSCNAYTCSTYNQGSTCNPVPQIDGNSYIVCGLVNNLCTETDPSNLEQSSCYTQSKYTYTWNSSQNKCVSCLNSTINNNNTNNINNTNETNNARLMYIILIIYVAFI